MKTLLFLFFLMAVLLTRSAGAEFQVFRATVTLPFINATFVDETDRFLYTRLSNKQLINLALGQPFKAKVPKGLVLAVLVPAGPSPFGNGSLIVFNTSTQAVERTIATLTPVNVLAPDDLAKPAVAIVEANFSALGNADFNALNFTLSGSGAGLLAVKPAGVNVTVKVTGLHGRFTRTDPQLSIYAGVVTAATLRVSGKSIATLNL